MYNRLITLYLTIQQMQAAGSPPEDLVANPLGDGMLQPGEDGVPGCPAQ
jgi:hypothetical protein